MEGVGHGGERMSRRSMEAYKRTACRIKNIQKSAESRHKETVHIERLADRKTCRRVSERKQQQYMDRLDQVITKHRVIGVDQLCGCPGTELEHVPQIGHDLRLRQREHQPQFRAAQQKNGVNVQGRAPERMWVANRNARVGAATCSSQFLQTRLVASLSKTARPALPAHTHTHTYTHTCMHTRTLTLTHAETAR